MLIPPCRRTTGVRCLTFVKVGYLSLMNSRTVSDKMQDWQKRATETAKQVGQATDRYVHENTWTTIAFAAVLGCLVGYFLAGRRD